MNITSATIQAVFNQVNDSASSIFSKEDVLKLVENMQYGIDREKDLLVEETITNSPFALDVDKLTDLVQEHVYDRADRMDTSDFLNYETAEFGLRGNEIELEAIDFSANGLMESITEGLHAAIQEYADSLIPKSDIVEIEKAEMDAAIVETLS